MQKEEMDRLESVLRKLKTKVKTSSPRPQILLVRIDPSQLYRRAFDLADGWACTHIHRKLWKPKSSWGKYSAEPLPDGGWPAGTILGPVVLCGRCTAKRTFGVFTNGEYPKATPEQLQRQREGEYSKVPPLEASVKTAKTGQ